VSKDGKTSQFDNLVRDKQAGRHHRVRCFGINKPIYNSWEPALEVSGFIAAQERHKTLLAETHIELVGSAGDVPAGFDKEA